MKISLINLDRSPDRLAQFTDFNRHLTGVSRFPAVDGTTVDVAALERANLLDRNVLATYTPGALGCALSHVTLWDRVIADREIGTICEDDAIFNRNFAQSAERVIAALPRDWDFILWGWNFDSYLLFELLPDVSPCLCCFDEEQMRAGVGRFQDHAVMPQVFRLQRALGIPCYSISAKGARVLKAACVPLARIRVFFPGLDRHVPNTGIDIMMNNAYPQIAAFVSFPPLVITRNEIGKSTVQME